MIQPKTAQGFTLIEVLVAVTIIGVVGFFLSDILVRTFSTSNKTQLIGIIKQNGQTALTTIDQTIRNADRIVCTASLPAGNTTLDNTLVVIKNGQFIRFGIHFDQTGAGNNYIFQDNPLQSDPADETSVCLSLESPAALKLTDTDSKTGVTVKSGYFQKTQATPGFKDVATIHFELSPAVNGKQDISNQIGTSTGTVIFNTTVGIR